MKIGFFSKVTSDRIRENGLKLEMSWGNLHRKNFFTERFIKYWNRLLREVVESVSLESLKRCSDVAVKDMV